MRPCLSSWLRADLSGTEGAGSFLPVPSVGSVTLFPGSGTSTPTTALGLESSGTPSMPRARRGDLIHYGGLWSGYGLSSPGISPPPGANQATPKYGSSFRHVEHDSAARARAISTTELAFGGDRASERLSTGRDASVVPEESRKTFDVV